MIPVNPQGYYPVNQTVTSRSLPMLWGRLLVLVCLGLLSLAPPVAAQAPTFTQSEYFYVFPERSDVSLAVFLPSIFTLADSSNPVANIEIIDGDPDSKFFVFASGDPNTHRLIYLAGVIEDVTLIPNYALIVRATAANGQTARTTVNMSVGICDRTEQIENQIVAILNDINPAKSHSCNNITAADLATITSFNASTSDRVGDKITSLIDVDFAGMSNLTNLELQENSITSLPQGVFDDLTNLNNLRLYSNGLRNLPQGVFDNLTNLTTLRLDDNALELLPQGIFDTLGNLNFLQLRFNQLDTLPEGVFSSLTNLTSLILQNNNLSTLPEGVFSSTTNLTRIDLENNNLSTLPEGVFSSTTNLTRIDLQNNNLSTLPLNLFENVFSELLAIEDYSLDITGNPTASFPVELSLEVLANNAFGEGVFRVRSNYPGPPVTVTWIATDPVDKSTTGGVLTIAVGAAISNSITLPINFRTIALSNPGLNIPAGSTYTPFTITASNRSGIIGVPQFDQAGGYTFNTTLYPTSFHGVSVGTVTAIDPDTLLPSTLYQMTDLVFSINNDGVITYNGGGNEVAGTNYTLIVVALDDGTGISGTVAVTIVVNEPPLLNPIGTLYLGDRSVVNNLIVGTIVAIDPEGEDLTYELYDGDVEKFRVGTNNGVLRYFDNVIEDITLNPSYTVFVRAKDGGQPSAPMAVILNIGICDRTAQVRDEIIASLNDQNGVTDFDCARVTVADLASIQKSTSTNTAGDFDFSADNRIGVELTSLVSVDFAGLSGVQRLLLQGNALSNLPPGVFDGLSNLSVLELEFNDLSGLPLGVFDDLSNLESLQINNNVLSMLPDGIFDSLTNLDNIRIDNNFFSTLQEGIFSNLSALKELRLHANSFSVLPPNLFENVFTNLPASTKYFLLLESNPTSSFPIGLFVETLPDNSDGDRVFRVRSDQPGPPITVTWIATDPTDNTNQSATLTINVGTALSSEVSVPSRFSDIVLDNPTITLLNDSIYTPFTVSTSETPVAFGAPYFEQADGYTFRTLYPDSVNGAILGTVAAIDPDTNVPALYQISDPLFSVNDNGVIRYRGVGGFAEPIGTVYSVIVTALNSGPGIDTTVAVTVVVNSPLVLVTNEPFYIGSRPQVSTELVLGTVGVSDVDGDTITFLINSGDQNKFSVGINSGALSYIGGVIEDVSIVPSYTIIVTASVANQSLSVPLTVIVGICDRTEQVRDQIVAAISTASRCETITTSELLSLSVFDLDPNNSGGGQPIDSLISLDFAALSGLQELYLSNNSLVAVPAGVFDGLSNLQVLRADNNALTALPVGIFDDLYRLSVLNLQYNQLTVLPARVVDGLVNLNQIRLNDNALVTLSYGMFDTQSNLRVLEIDNNNISTLPEDLFEGVFSDLSTSVPSYYVKAENNPGAPFTGYLSVQQLEDQSGMTIFKVRNSRPGLPLSVTWTATDQASTTTETGTLSIPVSTALSTGNGIFPKGLTQVVLSDVVILPALTNSGSRFSGFDLSAPTTTFLLNSPQFSQGSYNFSLDLNTTSVLVGTVSAIDPDGGAISYAIDSGDPSRFSIDSANAVISYIGSGAETAASQVLVVSAEDNEGFVSKVTVTVNINRLPTVAAAAPLYLGPRSLGSAVVLGTLAVIDLDGDPVADGYQFTIDPSNPVSGTLFDLSSGGVLSYVGTGIEDVTRIASYAVAVLASVAGQPDVVGTVTVNIGICDRTEPVRDTIVGFTSGVSSCETVTTENLSARTNNIELDNDGITSLIDIDFAGLSSIIDITLLNNPLSNLPVGIFDNLDSLRFLRMGGNRLNSLPVGVFDGLDSLILLELQGNALTVLPQQVFRGMTNLRRLELYENELTGLPLGLFADSSLLFNLELQDNRISRDGLPVGLFAGLTALGSESTGGLNVDGNPGADFPIELAVRLQMVGSSSGFVVRSSRPGPQLEVTWTASGNAIADTNGSVVVAAGTTDSAAVALPEGVSVISLSNAVIDDTRFQGFAPSVAPPNTVAAPQFEQSSYNFSLDVTSSPPVVLGTVIATAPGGNVSYSVDSGNSDSFSIDAGGVFSYLGGDGGTIIASQVQVIAANDSGAINTVNVAITVDYPPQLEVTPFYLGARTLGSSVVLGTLAVIDPDTTAVVGSDYQITAVTEAASSNLVSGTLFDLSSGGVLSYVGTGIEDVTRIASYAITVRASVAGGQSDFVGTVTVNIGICDRTERVRDVIVDEISGVSSCETITAANLLSFDDIELIKLTSLAAGDFAGISNLTAILMNIDNSLTSLPAGVFDGLSNLTNLELSSSLLSSLPVGVFAGLDSLEILYMDDNLLTDLPMGVFDSTSNLAEIYFRNNALIGLPPQVFSGLTKLRLLSLEVNALTGLSSGLFADSPLLRNIQLQDNQISRGGLPADLFVGLTALGGSAVNVGFLRVQDNPGADFPIELAVRLQMVGETPGFVVRSSRPGPQLEVTWTASGGSGSMTGSVVIGGGTADSAAVALPEGTTVISLSNAAVVNPTRLQGFALSVAPPNTVTAPQFDQSSYNFSLDATSSPPIVLGTLFATDPGDANVSYSIDSGDDGLYSIGSVDGVLRYIGSGAEILLSRELVVLASTGDGRVSTVNVTINSTETAPTVAATAALYLGARTLGSSVVLGTLAVSDADGDSVADGYQFTIDPSSPVGDRFALTEGGVLSYVGTGIEDVTRIASYAVGIRAAVTGQPDVVGTVTVNIGICDRTELVRDDIIGFISGVSSCETVTEANLSAIGVGINLQNDGITSLIDIDFAGLSNLIDINLSNNQLSNLPVDVFDGLGSLTELRIDNNLLSNLPVDVFDGLGSLTELRIDNNLLSNLPVGVFDGLGSLIELRIDNNLLSSLPVGIFDGGLDGLVSLLLNDNQFSSLPVGVFDGLDGLSFLRLQSNALTGLPQQVFRGMTNLRDLNFSNNELIELPLGLFAESSLLSTLELQDNRISRGGLPAGLFADLTALGSHSSARLRVEDNPGADFPIELAVRLQAVGSSSGFVVRSSRPGPRLEVTWTASGSSGSMTGSVVVAAGTTDSAAVALPEGVSVISLSNAVIDTDLFRGFALSVAPLNTVAAPQFEQSSYNFILELADQPSIVLGTVIATVPVGNVSYSVDDSNSDSFSIGSADGVLSYIGGDGGTIASQVQVIAANDSGAINAVNVAITVDYPPQLEVAPFYLGARSLGSAVVVGTVAVIDPDGDPVSVDSYQITAVTEATSSSTVSGTLFDLSGGGVLSYVGTGIEDVTRIASYAVAVLASVAGGQPDVVGTVTVNIGICDRTRQVRDTIVGFTSGVSSCETVTTENLSALTNNIDLDNDGITSLIDIDFAGLSSIINITLLNNPLSNLPVGIFDNLDSFRFLRMGGNRLNSLPVGVFDGLDSLILLELQGNALTVLPQQVFRGMTNLRRLELYENELTGLPLGLFADSSLLFNLELQDNQISRDGLPVGLFAGLTALGSESTGGLNVDGNPGADFPIELAVRLQAVGSSSGFVVRSSRPGPPLTVEWTASSGSGSMTGSVVIAAGTTDSTAVALPEGTTVISLSNAVIDDTRFQGFAPSVAPPNTVAAPQFEQSSYNFSLDATSSPPVVLGTVIATVPVGNVNYSIDNASFNVNADGVFSYFGGDGGTIASQVQVIAENDGGAINTVNVAITVDYPPQLESTPFYLGVRTLGSPVVLGTVAVIDPDTAANVGSDYQITAVTEAASSNPVSGTLFDFSSGGVLSYVGTGIEDVTRIASYAITVRASVAGGQPDVVGTVTVNIGICDRTEPVRDTIVGFTSGVSSCETVTTENLSARTNNIELDNDGITSLIDIDFAGLSSIIDITLLNNPLSNLPVGIFDNLDSFRFLRMGGNRLNSLPVGVFDGLDSLILLELQGNALTVLPQQVFRGMTNLRRLELYENELTGLPLGLFADSSLLFNLELQDNQISRDGLPVGLFAGLTALGSESTGGLNVDGNPGADFPIELAVRLPAVGATVGFVVRSSRPGPQLTVTWTASGNAISITGSVVITAGTTDSAVVALPEGTAVISLSNAAVVDPTRFQGFALSVAPSNTITAPQFEQDSYTFSQPSDDNRTPPIALGTVLAFSLNGEDVSYRINAGDTTRFSIGEDSGVISYVGTSKETISSWELTVSANNGTVENLVQVVVNINTDLVLTPPPSFYLSSRTAGSSVVVGTIEVTHSDTISYAITSEGVSKFSINSMGALFFSSSDFEDATLTASYTVGVSATAGSETVTTVATLLIGVCDRTPQVGAGIAVIVGKADCETVSAADLSNADGTLTLENQAISALSTMDFIALNNISGVSLNNNALSSLPSGVFDSIAGTLRTLGLNGNAFSNLPANVFDNLSNLRILELDDNGLTELPPGIFDNQINLRDLRLNNNALSSLPAGVFSNLIDLYTLRLHNNAFGSLPAGVFEDLSSLYTLLLDNNGFSSLPQEIFNDQINLRDLTLNNNVLTGLPQGIFDAPNALRSLQLQANNLLESGLPDDLFIGLANLDDPSDGQLRVDRDGDSLRNPGTPFVINLSVTQLPDASNGDAVFVVNTSRPGPPIAVNVIATDAVTGEIFVNDQSTISVPAGGRISNQFFVPPNFLDISLTTPVFGNDPDSDRYLGFELLVDVSAAVVDAPEFEAVENGYQFDLDIDLSTGLDVVVVGTVTASDPNNLPLVYSIIAGDLSRFTVDTSNNNGIIRYVGSGEPIGTRYTLTMEAFNIAQAGTVLVTVTAIDSAPVFNPTAYAFDLIEATSGTVNALPLGTVMAFDGNNEAVIYSVSGANSDKFSIDAASGVVTYIGTGESEGSTLGLTVTATAGVYFTTAAIVIDVFRLRFELPDGGYVFEIGKDMDGNQNPIAIGTVNAIAFGYPLTYAIVAGDPDKFSIRTDPEQGVIQYVGNGETATIRYTLTLQAQLISGRDVTTAATIMVLNQIPMFEAATYSFTLKWNRPGNQSAVVIGTVVAIDLDQEPLAYTIVAGDGFSVGATSGIVSYVGSGEEFGTTPSLTITANDDAAAATTQVTVIITNNTPVFVPDEYRFSLGENISGTLTAVVMGTVTAFDSDDDPLEYSIRSDIGLSDDFIVGATSGIVSYIGSGEVFDPNQNGDLPPLIVIADDGADFEVAQVYIQIGNDAPIFETAAYVFTLDRNFRATNPEIEIILGTVKATDPNEDSVNYTISGNVDFRIGATSGIVSYTGRGEVYNNDPILTVTADDGVLASTVTVLIRITNDAPIFNPTVYEFRLDRNRSGTQTGIRMGTVFAIDPNGDTINYSISSGDPNNRFSIYLNPEFPDETQGVIDYIGSGELSDISYNLIVAATDGPDIGTAQVTIKVLLSAVEMRTDMTNMTLAQVGRNIAIDTVDVLGGRFDAAPHVTISGNSLDAKQWSRLNRWMQLDHWQSAGAWNGVEREVGFDDIDLSEQWDKFQDKLLSGSSFLIPLQARRDDEGSNIGGMLQDWSIWGQGRVSGYEYTNGGIQVDGLVLSGYLGVDYRINERLLFGVAVSRSNSEGHSKSSADGANPTDIDSELTSVYPYVHWNPWAGFELWGMFGHGVGEVEIREQGADKLTADTKMLAAAFGGQQALISLDFADIAVKADGFVVQLTSDKVAGLNATDSESHRFRVALSGSRKWPISIYTYANSGVELGGRLDGGDALTGQGLDIGANLGYVALNAGFEVNSRVRFLIAHTEEYSEWGVDLIVKLRPPGQFDRGLSLTLSPGWGQATTTIDPLWENGVSSLKPTTNHDRGLVPDRTKLSLSYGLQYHSALLEPFAQMGMDRDLLSNLTLGLRLDLPRLQVEVSGNKAHQIEVKGVLGF